MKRYGMTIDVDRCNGCGSCMVACAVENNVPPANAGANERKGITWIRVFKVDNGEAYPNQRSAYVPMLCQQCGEEAPCAQVCPQQAVEVDPEKIPYGDTGLPGSILDIALANGIDIDHSCGGVCACSTCHCIVREGDTTLSDMTDAEDYQLSNAPGLTLKSRLSCQSVPDGTKNLVVEIPSWNRNAVREGH